MKRTSTRDEKNKKENGMGDTANKTCSRRSMKESQRTIKIRKVKSRNQCCAADLDKN